MANLAVRRRLQPAGGIERNDKRGITAQPHEYMKTALVKIEYPYGNSEQAAVQQKSCNAVLAQLEALSQTTTGIEKLDRSVWMLSIDKNLGTLASFLSQLQAIRVHSKTAFLEEPLTWISIDPKGS